MSILRIQPNRSYPIRLKYKSPIEKQGLSGKQFMYTLSDGQVLYLPPVAHAEIQSLNPGAGEAFTLLQSRSNGSAAVWSVERTPQPINEVPARPMAGAKQIATPDIPVPPSLTTTESVRIFMQLVATIQAVKAAEEFSISIGRPVVFGSEDIRAMGISGFIEQSRRAA